MTRIHAEGLGLKFTGDFSKDKENINAIRDEYREAEIKCAVVTESFRGKIKAAGSTGYSLYAEKELA